MAGSGVVVVVVVLVVVPTLSSHLGPSQAVCVVVLHSAPQYDR